MQIYEIDPLRDRRWQELVERDPRASVFHTVSWLKCLRLTYGYKPVVFTTSPAARELQNGLLFCRIDSWLTGRRLVSLPFADHCDPLCDSDDSLDFLIRYLQTTLERQNLRYLEFRPADETFRPISEMNRFRPAARFYLHLLDLRPELQELLRSLDKDSVQRRIQRAERAGLSEKCGRSDRLLSDFYSLFVMTRGRHGLPPIPLSWFRNLIRFSGEALEIRIAYNGAIPIAAILTLRNKHTAYYKYGCSNVQFNKLGAIPWLLWRAIAAAKLNGASQFDLGRTEEDNAGLLLFKNHWVSNPLPLVYWRFPETRSLHSINGWKRKILHSTFSSMPGALRKMAGNLIYRHIG